MPIFRKLTIADIAALDAAGTRAPGLVPTLESAPPPEATVAPSEPAPQLPAAVALADELRPYCRHIELASDASPPELRAVVAGRVGRDQLFRHLERRRVALWEDRDTGRLRLVSSPTLRRLALPTPSGGRAPVTLRVQFAPPGRVALLPGGPLIALLVALLLGLFAAAPARATDPVPIVTLPARGYTWIIAEHGRELWGREITRADGSHVGWHLRAQGRPSAATPASGRGVIVVDRRGMIFDCPDGNQAVVIGIPNGRRAPAVARATCQRAGKPGADASPLAPPAPTGGSAAG